MKFPKGFNKVAKPNKDPSEAQTNAPTIRITRKKVTAIKYDSDGDSVHEYGDYSVEKAKKDCKEEASEEIRAAKHKLNMIDPKNKPSVEKRLEESVHESDDDDGIPTITIPLGKVLEDYYKKIREQAASSEYSYEDQKSKEKETINDKLMKKIRDHVLGNEEVSEEVSEEL